MGANAPGSEDPKEERQQAPGPEGPPGGGVADAPTMDPKDERMWATFVHLAGFAFVVVPWGNVLGPLVIWLLKREESEVVDQHGKEALNFQISVTIYGMAAVVAVFFIVGFLLLPVIAIFATVCVIVAAVKANNGEFWRYPLTIRFIR